jgi:hypothetical protein
MRDSYIENIEEQNEFLLEDREAHLHALERYETLVEKFVPKIRELCDRENARLEYIQSRKDFDRPKNFAKRKRDCKILIHITEEFETLLGEKDDRRK